MLKACASYDLEEVKSLISQNHDVNEIHTDGSPAISFAIFGTKTISNTIAIHKKRVSIVKELIAAGAQLNVLDKLNRSPLFWAVNLHYYDITEILLQNNADPNLNKTSKKLLLHTAIKKNDYDMVKLLIDYNADLNKFGKHTTIITGDGRTATEFTPLHLAVEADELNFVKLIVDNSKNLNLRDSDGLTPLLLACRIHTLFLPELQPDTNNNDLNGDDNLEIIKYLIDHGADVNAQDSNETSPLIIAANFNSNVLAEILVSSPKIDLNIFTKHNLTPLHIACKKGNLEVVKTLCNGGDNINLNILGDEGSWTPLYSATTKDQAEVMKVLITSGADVNIPRDDGTPPVCEACLSGDNKAFKSVQLLIEAGADVNKCSKDNSTALYNACNYGNIDIVRALIDAGAHLDIITETGGSPLGIVCALGNYAIVELLLNAGADPNLQPRRPSRLCVATPLIAACCSGNTEVVKLLLKHGADVFYQLNNGDTPLSKASTYQGGFPAIVQVLKCEIQRRSSQEQEQIFNRLQS